MATTPCIGTTTFSRCAPRARLSSPTQLRPSGALTTSTWSTSAGGKVPGRALVSTRKRTTPRACNAGAGPGVNGFVDSGAIGGGGVGGGLTLAEVVAVKIGNINRQSAGKLYGTITIRDGFGTSQLYKRDKHNYQVVGPGGMAELTYPPRAISGAQNFVIDVDLMDHYSWIPMNDRVVALGRVTWNSRDALPADYNRVLRGRQVMGEYGNVEVQYAVLSDAVVGAVEVVVSSSGNSTFSPDVYGSVTARTTMASGEKLEYCLFDRPRNKHTEVREGTAIPLQRKLISAPLCSEGVEVSANLWDANAVESDDQIVYGSVVFTPCVAGTNKAEIMGPRGKVTVDVTWST